MFAQLYFFPVAFIDRTVYIQNNFPLGSHFVEESRIECIGGIIGVISNLPRPFYTNILVS